MKEAVILALCAGLASPALAGHNNPWTDDLSILKEQYHDANQEQSIDTPGEDEMRGEMEQNANGKLDGGSGGGGSQGSGEGKGGGGRR
ncbi:hypothetical protein [Actibacterium pelagium]|uniref:Uncharacterized protein n=1 Tax=Actibacterium pelagium TaxID=2029103 RepID=A0A917AGN4_9RHOB|nr:hypothetical protein [Actibacterium pelagium]GGE50103.1 hypothetical protein GCM10011517_17360 [Actibacterium pelagium]